jgi:hypothetical protein
VTNDPRLYATPAAFRQALEARLRRHAEEHSEELMRIRRQVAFDRLLARVFAAQDGPWALKGGYALQLRFAEARTTRDVDLSLQTPANLPPGSTIARRLQEELQRLGNLDAADFFVFVVEPATLDIDAAPFGGARFPIDARLAGRTFVKFQVDIGIGDPLLEPTDALNGRDWLGFAGIPAPSFTCISKEQQFAEKLHAYTTPDRPRPNSRVKDLVDMVLMIRRFDLDLERLTDAILATFSRRDSHPPPETLPPPPENWEEPFAALAEETGLDVTSTEAFAELEQYLWSMRSKQR